ncbi:ADP-ribosyl-[dinitrogen reductase] glycohydrolase [Pirellula sp. SH-Sr6A]|uniref:ADP-ribosylglycohydrolase family protein n=1 Tax=Pirellula sp. SH-Sr6A TaxID=1632865 RepID=UPI00078B64D3|nr:ADP-ribosylglycohydrolase family protein [Pirellula sp. SH-Sr6A]AMV31492.1 ADP-ribosyl-[dinitrogen reductase] glycohydrolase [Pirellula sp. SH-Sr6A]
MASEKAIVGCILGTAVGDALGLPYEGMSPTRASKLLGPAVRYRFLLGRGMISDDTEHTCMVSQSLIESGGHVEAFSRRFASRLRWWILALPAGVGKATARSCIKLWLGIRPSKSGVYSAGNGPAMRAPILGATMDDVSQLLEFVRASSLITHSDPKAEYGAIAVALAARESSRCENVQAERWLELVSQSLPREATEWVEILRSTIRSVAQHESTLSFAQGLGLGRGVSGYTYHTVPVAIHCWLSFPNDFHKAVSEAIACGGDADTTAAIVGGIVGARVGKEGIPAEWLTGIWECPRTVRWMEALGRNLAHSWPVPQPGRAPRANPGMVLMRNLLFLAIVLCHGFRRLAPPY